MGYDIYIGEAKITTWGDDDGGEYRVRVDGMRSDDAPEFPGDSMTGKGNSRHPSYSSWADFARDMGLHDLFFDGESGLMSQHPGCFRLTRAHHEEIAAALAAHRATCDAAGKVPGWDPDLKEPDSFTGRGADPKYDGNLARLMWLEWWVRWALDNCKMPAIYNH